jgi:hypothetical protein
MRTFQIVSMCAITITCAAAHDASWCGHDDAVNEQIEADLAATSRAHEEFVRHRRLSAADDSSSGAKLVQAPSVGEVRASMQGQPPVSFAVSGEVQSSGSKRQLPSIALRRSLTAADNNNVFTDEKGRKWRPIRIKPIYVKLGEQHTWMTPARIADLKEAQTEVLRRLSNYLMVPYSEEPLFASRKCTSGWEFSNGDYKCASFASSTCGPQGTNDGHTFDDSWLGPFVWHETSTGPPITAAAGAGLSGFDFGLFITSWGKPSCSVGGSGTLAYAASCQRDITDRPTWGYTNW